MIRPVMTKTTVTSVCAVCKVRGAGVAHVPGCPGSPFRYLAGTLTHGGDSVGRAQGHSSGSWTHLEFLKTCLGLAAAPPSILITSSGNELTHLSLPVEQRMLMLFEHLPCARPFPNSFCLAPQTWKTCRSWFCGLRVPLPSSMTTDLSSTPPAMTPRGCGSSTPAVSSCPPLRPPTPLPRGLVPHLGLWAGPARALGWPWGPEQEESDALRLVGWHL